MSSRSDENSDSAERPMRDDDWPRPPIWPEDLLPTRELLTDKEHVPPNQERTVQLIVEASAGLVVGRASYSQPQHLDGSVMGHR